MSRSLKTILVAMLAFAAPLPAMAQKTPITIYTALENEQLGPFKAEIEKAVPEADVQWVRDSTGVITARFLAEKAAPKADMVMGLAASSLLVFKKEGLLEIYKAAGTDKLKPQFVDKDGAFVGMDAYLGVISYNTAEGGKLGTTVPVSYKDLLNPKFKGQVVMPHPASSGTGYLIVAAWLQTMGEAEAWKFMDALHENIAVYTHSGSAPCVQSAKGERVAGLCLDMRAAKEKTAGAPIEVIVPKEGVGWELEATSIVKGTQKLAVAKKIMDWVASKEANTAYSKFYAIVAHPDVKNFPANYPSTAEAAMANVNLQAMADQREATLKEWSKRYEAKAAPKN
jgi:iron(III) transport system substrate-binding protein